RYVPGPRDPAVPQGAGHRDSRGDRRGRRPGHAASGRRSMSAEAVTEQRGSTPALAEPGVLASLWASTPLFRPVFILLIALLVALTVAEKGLFTELNLESIGTTVSILWLIALGATFVQLSGGIDLSSGAVAALSGICLAKLLGTGLPGWLVIILV